LLPRGDECHHGDAAGEHEEEEELVDDARYAGHRRSSIDRGHSIVIRHGRPGPGGNAVGGAIAAYGTAVIVNSNFQLSSSHGGQGGAGGNGITGGAGGPGGAASGGAVYAAGGLGIGNVLFQGSLAAGGTGGAGGGYGTSPSVPGSTAAAGGAGGAAVGGAV